MATTTISFIYQWQTLIGSALGPFLAIILSLFGFLLSRVYTSWANKKESVRRIEVSITRSLNDMYSTRKKMENFVKRLKELVVEIRAITDEKTFALQRINYPAVRDIFFDTDLPNLITGSFYVHNLLMFSDAGIKETNSWLKEMKENFGTLSEKNEFLVELSPKPIPHDQRTGYAENLELFAEAVEGFMVYIKTGIKMATQIKVYNLKLREARIKTIMINEASHFKYFKNKEELNNYKKWENIIARVDKKIEKEVTQSLDETEEKFKALPITPQAL